MPRSLNRMRNATTAEEAAWAEKQMQELREWNDAIARVVSYAIRTTSVSEFARRIQYSRPTLWELLHQEGKERQRPWTLDTLIAISREIGCSLPELLAAAETVKGNPGGAPALSLRLCGTPPRSKERLQRLIYEAVGYDGDYDETQCNKLTEVIYRLRDVECGNPGFCTDYYEGRLSDREALAELRKADAFREHENEPSWPLWAALRETYKG